MVYGGFCYFNNLRFRCAEVKSHLYIERTQINRYEISYFPHFILQYSFVSCSVSYLVAQLLYNSLCLSVCLSEAKHFGSFCKIAGWFLKYHLSMSFYYFIFIFHPPWVTSSFTILKINYNKILYNLQPLHSFQIWYTNPWHKKLWLL